MTIVALSLLLIMLAASAALVRWERHPATGPRLFRVLVGGGCLLAAGAAIAVLVGVSLPTVAVSTSIPGGPWTFALDRLSAVFVLAIAAVGAACAGYGLPYLRGRATDGAVRRAHALVALLIASLLLVVIATAVMPFLIAWELMAITSYLLVIFEDERPTVRRAGLLYLIATHVSLLALFGLFALWGRGAHDLTFAALAAAAPGLPAGATAVLLVTLVAFGIKAGVVPLHVWLPEAHAAAPSHVSALMSGVVIKMGIYGLLRVVSLVGVPPAWWGWLVLTLGIISGILGVVWALAQHDIKRLLAFHSVENIGIILIGIGAGALGLAYRLPVVAVLGFAGAVLHTLNHALFKSLLFLGGGSVIHETGTRELDKLGGLATRMPVTATAFLIGAAAIVGLPPLNGFVSEWLVYRSFLAASVTTSPMRIAVLAVGALALIGALALACFAKVVGVVFLGRARDPLPATVREAPTGLLRPVIELAILCVAIGALPIMVVPPALHVGELLAGAGVTSAGVTVDPDLVMFGTFTLALAGGLVLACGLYVWRLGRGRPIPAVETWGCGFAFPDARMQYTASSFAAPLVGVFRSVTGVETERSPSTFRTHAHDPVLDRVARPAWDHLRAGTRRLQPIQHGRLARSLLYMIAVVLIALTYLVLAAGSA